MGVPGPTRVSRSFSWTLSMSFLLDAAPRTPVGGYESP